jgi:hypothetical protein
MAFLRITSKSISRKGVLLLCAGLFLISFSALLSQNQPQSRISIPIYLNGNARPGDRGIYTAAGIRYNDHELSLKFPNWARIGKGNYFTLQYRYYLPHAGRTAKSFLAFETGTGDDYFWSGSRGNLIKVGLKSRSLYAGLGLDKRLWANTYGYFQLGFGFFTEKAELLGANWRSGSAPQLSFGLKYDIPLKGERNQENTLPEDYTSRPRLFFSYKWKFQPSDPANDLYIGFGATNHQFTLEVGLLRWMRVYGGLQFGGLQNQSDTLGFGFQGGGLGLKLHLYQWKRLAFFNEIGYFYLRRPEYNFYSSRVLIGNSLEYRVRPGFYLFGGQVMGIVNNYFIHEFQVGVTVSPGEIFR